MPRIRIIEASQDPKGGMSNWGKFMVMRFTEPEWTYRSRLPQAQEYQPLDRWGPDTLMVLDLATGEGALFSVRKNASVEYDLNQKHQIWVCPLFQPFLQWLYDFDAGNRPLEDLPDIVTLPDADFSFAGYRRRGTT